MWFNLGLVDFQGRDDMDPNATFDSLNDAVHNGDTDTANDLCVVLFVWIDGGGFKPDGFTSRWESDENATEYYDNYVCGVAS